MSVAIPHIDLLWSGHNLESLEEFATTLPRSQIGDDLRWSISLRSEGDRPVKREEIVEARRCGGRHEGIASGIGTASYAAQIVVEAPTSEEAVRPRRR